MKTKKITIIVNPASGKKDSILWSLNKALHKLNWDIKITHAKNDAFNFAKELLKSKPKILGVYGGDGTVTEVAQALYKTNIALFIIPGGTNNVIAKELGISTDVDEALSAFIKNNYKIEKIDMGLFRNKPFILRIETGLIAEVVKNTKRGSKSKYGQLSYAAQLLPQLKKLKENKYVLYLDDKEKLCVSGISLVVANVGNVGIEGYSIISKSNVKDGFLEIVLFKNQPLNTLLSWIKSTASNKKPKGAIKHWKAKKVKVIFENRQTIIFDDQHLKVKTIEAEISPSALQVVVPK